MEIGKEGTLVAIKVEPAMAHRLHSLLEQFRQILSEEAELLELDVCPDVKFVRIQPYPEMCWWDAPLTDRARDLLIEVFGPVDERSLGEVANAHLRVIAVRDRYYGRRSKYSPLPDLSVMDEAERRLLFDGICVVDPTRIDEAWMANAAAERQYERIRRGLRRDTTALRHLRSVMMEAGLWLDGEVPPSPPNLYEWSPPRP